MTKTRCDRRGSTQHTDATSLAASPVVLASNLMAAASQRVYGGGLSGSERYRVAIGGCAILHSDGDVSWQPCRVAYGLRFSERMPRQTTR
jgi:hypothetical protein